ncbi:DUF6197 family protein [Rhodococcus qingshengii]|uniref:DUF6197 family protein n=1 Tax=Rhodococcus qingshengii TaxID=334542 RepID=UPI0035D85C02
MSEVSNVLNHAADILERDGWIQGAMYNRDGCRCALGALHSASRELGYDREPVWDACTLIGPRLSDAGYTAWDLPGWNDEDGRTITEVTTLFRNAAKAAA